MTSQYLKKQKEEKKPRFTKQELSQFSQSQYEDIIGKIRKEGIFTTGEKEIKKKETQQTQNQNEQIISIFFNSINQFSIQFL